MLNLHREVHSGQSGASPLRKEEAYVEEKGISAEQKVQRTRRMSPCSCTFLTSFSLIFDFAFPVALASELALPNRPTRSSKPSMFCVYERSSFPFVSRVLINQCVGEGETLSIDCFSFEMNV